MIKINEEDKTIIILNAPESEPERQYYFVEQCRKIVKTIENDLGRKLTACINTFGCQMNAKDSEKLTGIIKMIGYSISESEKSDFVLYNTCTVREHANDRVYGRLGVLKSYKIQNKNMITAVCGCMMQESHVVSRIKQSYRNVNIIFGTHNIYKLAELLFLYFAEEKMQIEIFDKAEKTVENLPSERKFPFKSGVNIMYGCNNFCSYCIVPYVRGRERSRGFNDIINEITSLSREGVVEVMLLGQNVNSYQYDFPKLLLETSKIEGIKRVRFMTSHPKDLSDELIQVIRNTPKIARHIHLPLQSGSSRILKEMNRKYTKEDYLKLIEKIRENIPEVSITTDIIVGFPGESEEDFLDTLDVVKKAEFDGAYTFIYSKRSGTKAAEMPNQIPKDVTDDRFSRLLSLVNEIASKRTELLVNSCQEVLVESVNTKEKGYITGRLSNNSVVHFQGDEILIGKIVPVKILKSFGFYYYGEIVSEVQN